MAPDIFLFKPDIVLITDVFPAPLAPNNVVIEPFSTLKLTSLIA